MVWDAVLSADFGRSCFARHLAVSADGVRGTCSRRRLDSNCPHASAPTTTTTTMTSCAMTYTVVSSVTPTSPPWLRLSLSSSSILLLLLGDCSELFHSKTDVTRRRRAFHCHRRRDHRRALIIRSFVIIIAISQPRSLPPLSHTQTSWHLHSHPSSPSLPSRPHQIFTADAFSFLCYFFLFSLPFKVLDAIAHAMQ